VTADQPDAPEKRQKEKSPATGTQTLLRGLALLECVAEGIGDVKGIAQTFDRELSESPALQQDLIRQRNANWSKWIEQRMDRPGTVMIAVGAGHLAGKYSVLEMLKRDGYRVRRLQ